MLPEIQPSEQKFSALGLENQTKATITDCFPLSCCCSMCVSVCGTLLEKGWPEAGAESVLLAPQPSCHHCI